MHYASWVLSASVSWGIMLSNWVQRVAFKRKANGNSSLLLSGFKKQHKHVWRGCLCAEITRVSSYVYTSMMMGYCRMSVSTYLCGDILKTRQRIFEFHIVWHGWPMSLSLKHCFEWIHFKYFNDWVIWIGNITKLLLLEISLTRAIELKIINYGHLGIILILGLIL